MPELHAPINHTVDAIYQAYEASRGEAYEGLGISISNLGEECPRALWYGFRWASDPEKIDGLKAITFETGNIEEKRLLKALRMIGCEVIDTDAKGRQERVSAVSGHVRGKTDGAVLGLPEAPKTWHVVEAKSMKETYFKAVVKKGVREGYFSHWVQLNTYCYLKGWDRGLYICRNKNTGEVYCERIETDHETAIRMLASAERIIYAPEPPTKLHDDPEKKTAFKCKSMCRHKAICHDKAFPRVSCRTCVHATPERFGDAAWNCARWGKPLSVDEQRQACPAHLFIPAIVPGEIVEVNEEEEWISYALHDGRRWRDGSSAETPAIRYWYHPESDCLFTTEAGETAPNEGDPLCEEVSAEQFAAIQAARAKEAA